MLKDKAIKKKLDEFEIELISEIGKVFGISQRTLVTSDGYINIKWHPEYKLDVKALDNFRNTMIHQFALRITEKKNKIPLGLIPPSYKCNKRIVTFLNKGNPKK